MPAKPSSPTEPSSLWTTPISSTPRPLPSMRVDPNVTPEQVRASVERVRDRIAAFSTDVDEELLRKVF